VSTREAWERGPDAYRDSPEEKRQPMVPRDVTERFRALRQSGFTGPIDQDGRAVMSRTDNRGRPLDLFRGGTGHGTPDDRNTRTDRKPPARRRQGRTR
jgi:hypothetical protein